MSLFTTFPAVDIHSAVTIPKLGDIKYSFFVMQEQSPDTSLLCNLTKNRKKKKKHKTSAGKKAACESIEKVIRNKIFFFFFFFMLPPLCSSTPLLCLLHSTLSSYFWLLSKSSFKSFGFSFARSSQRAWSCSYDCEGRLKGTAQSPVGEFTPVSLKHRWHTK